MKKSDEYLIDTVKNMSVGLIVSSLVGFFLNPQKPFLPLFVVLICGIIMNVYGYKLTRYKEENK